MKRGLLSSALAIPVLAMCVGGSASASSAVRPSPAVAKLSRIVVIDCASKARTRPVSFVIACADGNNYLSGLTWTKWTRGLASGAGLETANDCQPSCAQGNVHTFRVQVALRGSAPVKTVKRHGRERRYTTLTLHYPGLRPSYCDGRKWINGPETATYQLWS